MKLLLQYAATRCKRSVDKLAIEDLTGPLVLDFLADLETNRGDTTRTRNARLAGVQTFFRYVRGEPALAGLCGPVLAIPAKKTIRPVLGYLMNTNLVTCWHKSIVWPSMENVITYSSACFMIPALAFKNCLTSHPATSTWRRRHSFGSAAKDVVNAYAPYCRNRPGSFARSCLPRGVALMNKSRYFKIGRELG